VVKRKIYLIHSINIWILSYADKEIVWSLAFSEFHQHFTSSFYVDILLPKNYQAKL